MLKHLLAFVSLLSVILTSGIASAQSTTREAELTRYGYATALASDAEIARLRTRGVRVELDAARTDAVMTSVIQSIPHFAAYRTVEETYNDLSTLAAANPNLATWRDIGNSWEKVTPGGNAGYDIFALVLTNKFIPGPKPKFLLIAAIHGRAYATAELATRFAEDLVAKYNVDADSTWLLDNFELHVIPQANPDGRKLAESGDLWRKNTDNDDGCRQSRSWGTDLNRNSSFKWNNGGSSNNPCAETYRGSSAASEPETQTIQNYATSIFVDQRGPNDTDTAPATTQDIFITLHSNGERVLFPWSWTSTPAPNSTQLQTLGRKFGFYNRYQVCNSPVCLYAASGTTDDFTYGSFGVASYTFVLGTAFFQDSDYFETRILPQNMLALRYAFKAARRPYQDPLGPDARDVTITPSCSAGCTSFDLRAILDDTQYFSNGWGIEPTQTIQAGLYSIDTPPWAATTTYPLAATDGAFDSSVENVSAVINTTGLSVGRHIIYVYGKDANGNKGVPTAVFLTIP